MRLEAFAVGCARGLGACRSAPSHHRRLGKDMDDVVERVGKMGCAGKLPQPNINPQPQGMAASRNDEN
jgi:hypothetical protein